ncbi:HEPN domain-containing protein [Neptunomonas phycophila]|uniref:HEPN domain-containing protein n=1 Tax=Neptunomonas phycophila TaxID=1572645 RepID=UPI000A77E054|nr:HEPN domain-containing protein [Neptunomonas phycophila]
MDEDLKVALYRIANMLLEEADKDYVLARHCFRYNYRLQYVWSKSQAIEKYLKSILLYNCKSARYRSKDKEYGHLLAKLLSAVRNIQDMKITSFPEMGDYIKKAEVGAKSRYGTYSIWFNTADLKNLDRTVFELRKYCKPAFGTFTLKGKEYSCLKDLCDQVNRKEFRSRPIGQLYLNQMNGYLKKLLKPEGSVFKYGVENQRSDLLWGNEPFSSCSAADDNEFCSFHSSPEIDDLYFGVSKEVIEKYVKL